MNNFFTKIIKLIIIMLFFYSCEVTEQTKMENFSSKITGSEAIFIGDSVIAMSGLIVTDLNQLAKNDGVLDSTDSFRSYAEVGAKLYGGSEPPALHG